MNMIRHFSRFRDPGSRRSAAAAGLVVLGIFILLGALLFVFWFTAAAREGIALAVPTTPKPAVSVRPEVEPTTGELPALREALAAAEAQRDALRMQLEAAEAEAARLAGELSGTKAQSEQLTQELEALRREAKTVYTLRFRVERKIPLLQNTEVLTFTCTVDKDTFDRWNNGDTVTDTSGLLTIPAGGTFHEWSVIMEEKHAKTS